LTSLSFNENGSIVTLQSPFTWKRIGEVLEIEGTLLAEGRWTGLDGVPIYYPSEAIKSAIDSAVGIPIKYKHRDEAEAVCGFVTAVKWSGNRADFKGIIFSKDVIDRVELGLLDGVSMEAYVNTKEEADRGLVATSLKFTAVALVENPACEECRISTVCPISLQKPTGEKEDAPTGEVVGMAENKPKPEEFFKWIEDKLKAAGISEEVIGKIMDILKKAIKVPYPYPSPEKYPEPKKAEDVFPIEGLTEEIPAEEFLAKPTRAAFLRWFRNQLKKLDLKPEQVTAVMNLFKKAIKTPYPYPYPAPVKGEAPEEYEAKMKEKDELIARLEKEKSDLEAELRAIREAEVKSLLERVKELDKEFDADKFFEGIDDLELRKRMLERYLESIQRVTKGPSVQLSVDDTSALEQRITQVLKSMGIDDVKAFIESR